MSTPTTLHKQSRKRDRSPVLSAESMAIYGRAHRALAYRWRVVQLPLFPAKGKGATS